MSTQIEPFVRLRGNSKTQFDDEVGPVTLFLGPNQTGKTGRLVAVKYALAGVKAGQIGRHGSEINQLAANPDVGFFAELTGPSGTARFEVRVEGGKAREPNERPTYAGALAELAAHESVLPLQSAVLPGVPVTEMLSLGTDRARRAFMSRFASLDAVRAPIGLLPDQQVRWDDAVKAATAQLARRESNGLTVEADPVDVLIEVERAFDRAKRAASREYGSLERAVSERQAARNEQAAGAEQIPQLQAQLERARAWEKSEAQRARLQVNEALKAAWREKAAPFHEADLRAEAAARAREVERCDLVAAIAEAETRTQLTQAGEGLPEGLSRAEHELRLQRGVAYLEVAENGVRARAETGRCACPLCGNPDWEVEEFHAYVQASVQKRRDAVAEADRAIQAALDEEKAARAALDAWSTQRAKEESADREARAALAAERERILTAEKEIRAAIANMGAGEEYTGPSSADLQREISSLQEAIETEKRIIEDTTRLRELKQAQEAAKALQSDAQKLLAAYTAQVKAHAEAEVNRAMPNGLRATVDLARYEWCVVDKKGEPRNRHTMSGYEQNALMIALAAAYTSQSPLRVLTLDDQDLAGLGDENVVPFFSMLVKAQKEGVFTQVFVAGNRLTHHVDELRQIGVRPLFVEGTPPLPQVSFRGVLGI